MTLGKYLSNYQTVVDEVNILIEKYEALKSSDVELITKFSEDPELSNLVTENRKLKFRLGIMKRAIEDSGQGKQCINSTKLPKNQDKSKSLPANNIKAFKVKSPEDFDLSGGRMVNILGYIEALFTKAVFKVHPDVPQDFTVQIQVSKMADYQCNVAMSLAKVMKKNPKEVAELVVAAVDSNPVMKKLEISGPGFININLDLDFIRKQMELLIQKGVTPPSVEKKRVVIDFSSPNIAKEMHVGHLRSTIIGEGISRLLEFLGHDVLRLNHLGDWGTQFGMLIAHVKDRFPDFATVSPPIGDLQAFYKESKTRFDSDEEFKVRAYDAVVKLQSHEPLHFKAWNLICDVSVREFQKVYDRLGVVIEPRGESFYQSRMEDVVKELDKRGLLSLEDGRKVMYAEKADIPLTVVKSDGAFTYDTSDLACFRQRVTEEKADWIVYVTDAGQTQHFDSLFACCARAGFYDPSKVRIDHVTFGVVLGEDKKKFKTRSGDTVRLIDLLNEGVERAAVILREKGRDSALSETEFDEAKKSVAYGCVKYADLSHDRRRDYVFSFDRMLDFKGNTAAYLLYALTRIRSIVRNAGICRETLKADVSKYLPDLSHDKEWKLAKTLLKLPDVIIKLSQDLCLHPLCEYLYEISTTFTEFYDNCYCIEKDSDGKVLKINHHRLLLCEATAVVMEKCFDLLAISPLEKM